VKTASLLFGVLLSVSGQVEAKPDAYAFPNGTYEEMLGCYVYVMESKGFDIDTPDKLLSRSDSDARDQCVVEFEKHARLVGKKRAERDWKGLWEEYWARL
jgi:hypothetical protein